MAEYMKLNGTFSKADLVSKCQPTDSSSGTPNATKDSQLARKQSSPETKSLNLYHKSRASSALMAKSKSDRTGCSSVAQKSIHRPRKGHTKSRRGCLNCKQRKIKVPASALLDSEFKSDR
jgi:hypothetical protein